MPPPATFTFVVTTQNNQNAQSFVPQINAHIAAHTHAKRRAKLPSYKPSRPPQVEEKKNLLTIRTNVSVFSNADNLQRTPSSSSHSDEDEYSSASSISSTSSLVASPIPKQTLCRNTHVVTDRALLSVLDPFIKLPFAINTRDKGLLHYFLNELRLSVRLAGTSANPQRCLALQTARTWMEYHPIYVVGKLLCCDFMLSNVPGKELPMTYYRRKSQMLNMMRDVLLQRDSSFSLKLYAMMTVIWEAVSTRQPDLPIHMQAMDSLVESYGGMSVFLYPEKSGPTMRPEALLGMFIMIGYRISHRTILDAVLDRFMNTLPRIKCWATSIQTRTNTLSLAPESSLELLNSIHYAHRAKLLIPLTKFLTDAMINPAFFSTDSNTDNVPFFIAASPFFCVYNICMTYVENDFTSDQAFEYLECVQHNLSLVNHHCAYGGVALANLMADSRTHMLPTPWRGADKGVDVTEIRICQASIDALKVYALMSAETRMRITWLLYDVVMMVVSRVSVQSSFTDTQLEVWREEIEETWLASHL